LCGAGVALVAGGGIKTRKGLERRNFSAHDVRNIHIVSQNSCLNASLKIAGSAIADWAIKHLLQDSG
jgi:hypothetical protein